MIRVAGTIIALTLAVVPALAQERPPEAEPDTAQTADRPPEKPEAAEPARAPDPVPDAISESVPDEPAAQPFGPPPPPVWFTLAETDAEYDACRLALSVMGAQFRPQPPVTDPDNRDCGIARPLQVSRILPDVAPSGEPVMRCAAALSLAAVDADFPCSLPRASARNAAPDRAGDRTGLFLPRPRGDRRGRSETVGTRLWQRDRRDGLSLRRWRSRAGAAAPRRRRFRRKAFRKAAQGTGCLLFTTVLGPGSNAAHDDHLHLDMAARNGGWRLCE